MKQIGNMSNEITMTSLELVDFINADRKERAQALGAVFPSHGFAKLEHSDFMKKVPVVLGERAGNFSATYQIPGPNGSSRTAPGYRFPKREACLMAMSYSYELQAKVFDRMTELESAMTKPALAPATLSRLQLIEIAMQAEQERLALEHQVHALAPKAAIHDRIADAEGSISIRETANTLRIPERKFVQWLQQHDWVYRRAGHKSLLGYAEKVKQGLLYLKQTPIKDTQTGEDRLSEQVRITPLGLTVLAKKLAGGPDSMSQMELA